MSRPSTWTKKFQVTSNLLDDQLCWFQIFHFFFQWKIQVERYKTDRVSYHLAYQITLDLWRQRRKINRNWWSTLSTIRWKLTLGRCWYSPPLEETYKMQKSIKQQEAFPVFSQGLELKRKKNPYVCSQYRWFDRWASIDFHPKYLAFSFFLFIETRSTSTGQIRRMKQNWADCSSSLFAARVIFLNVISTNLHVAEATSNIGQVTRWPLPNLHNLQTTNTNAN